MAAARYRLIVGSAGLLLAVTVALAAAAAPASLSPEEQQRARRLQERLVAPCCWQETVATHNSDLVRTIRGEIVDMVAAGRTDEEILSTYKQRYGARILVEPEGALWWWANIVPLLATIAALILGALAVWHLSRRRVTPPMRAVPPPGQPLPDIDFDD
jgi:cytochrome c-type biogenesis protein CcmH